MYLYFHNGNNIFIVHNIYVGTTIRVWANNDSPKLFLFHLGFVEHSFQLFPIFHIFHMFSDLILVEFYITNHVGDALRFRHASFVDAFCQQYGQLQDIRRDWITYFLAKASLSLLNGSSEPSQGGGNFIQTIIGKDLGSWEEGTRIGTESNPKRSFHCEICLFTRYLESEVYGHDP